jgi:hypothetical protein
MTRRRLSAIPGTLLCAALVAACAAVPSPFLSAPPSATAPATATTTPSTGPSAGPILAATPPGPPARYDDGLPRTLGGLPVLRGAAALARAATADDAPFLLGGWVTNVPGAVYSCPAETGPGSRWLAPCGQPAFSDVAGDPHPVLVARGLLTFRMADVSALESGPAILRVHVRDPRAAQCGAESAACARAMVVEAAVWTGDSATAPRPLDISAVSAALRSVVPGVTLAPLGPGVGLADCGVVLATSRAYAVPAPAPRTPTVSLVEIAPSSEALARALPIPAGPSGALAPGAQVAQVITSSASGTFECRWLRTSNVAVLVRTSNPRPTSADAAFVRRLAAALGEAAQASTSSPVTEAASQAPATTLDNPTVTVSTSTGLRDGQAVTVSVTGFGVGGKAWVSECASSAVATDLGRRLSSPMRHDVQGITEPRPPSSRAG